jgi:hypothetical protein
MIDPKKEWMAVPVSTIDGYTQAGMTLRDYFAAQCISMQASFRADDMHAEAVAIMAYKYADAMLKAREQ